MLQNRFLKNFTKFKGKHLCWSRFLTKLHVSGPETSLKSDSSKGIFLWILHNFSKDFVCLQNTSGWLLLLIPPFQPRFYPLITHCSFFSFIFALSLLITVFLRKCIKNEDVFTFYTSLLKKSNMNTAKTISPRQ